MEQVVRGQTDLDLVLMGVSVRLSSRPAIFSVRFFSIFRVASLPSCLVRIRKGGSGARVFRQES